MHPGWYISSLFGLTLEGILLWRATRCRLWSYYPFFCAYLLYTATWSIVFGLPAVIKSAAYAKAFWLSYFLAAVLRFGIAVEIHRHVFRRWAPVRAAANVIVLLTLLTLAIIFCLTPSNPAFPALPDMLRKIAISVAIWIFVVLSLGRYYRIPIGRNVWGMAVGILTFTGSELIYLAAMDLVPALWPVWRYVHPLTFIIMLVIWCVAMWEYYPNPQVQLPDGSVLDPLLTLWRDRWIQVPNVVRRLIKPWLA
jgi:hypothetical protein